MQTATRALFSAYLNRQAELNGVPVATVHGEKAFTVDPTVQQRLIDKQQESSAFLQAINVVTVPEMKAAKLGLGVSGPIASRTNTATTDRATKDPSALDSDDFECKQTNSDTHLTYAKLDMWAKYPDFQVRIRNQIVRRQALDRIMIGFNGVSAAVATDMATYPLLQDVNIGWLQKMRATAPTHVLATGDAEAGKIIIAPGADGDYANLDALVYDARYNLMPSWAREDTELVAIVGSDLLHDKYFPMVNVDHDPTEQLARDIIMSKKQLGGLPAARVPFFPAGTVLITRYDNLSIYEQEGKRRRTIVDNAKRDRVENFESSNDAYVVEDYDYGVLIEKIQIGPTAE